MSETPGADAADAAAPSPQEVIAAHLREHCYRGGAANPRVMAAAAVEALLEAGYELRGPGDAGAA